MKKKKSKSRSSLTAKRTAHNRPVAGSTPASATSTIKPKRKRSLKRRSVGSANALYDTDRPSYKQAGQNMLELLGGREAVLSILEESAHPKVAALMDRLQAKQYIGENFATSYTSVGLKAIDVLEIFGNVVQARVFISALNDGDKVMQSLIRAAKDQIEPHDKCDCTGRQLDRKTGNPTDIECKPCRGTGYTLKSGSRDSQELFFELMEWKKQGGLINIDARKQQAHIYNSGGAGMLSLSPGGVPEVASLIQRADQVLLPAARPGSIDLMPEDQILEGEPA